MTKEEKKEYYKIKLREWRKKNRARDLELKKKWRDENKEYRRKMNRKYFNDNREKIRERLREYYNKNPLKFKQDKDYINNYMKKYNKDKKNHEKYLVRQKDYSKFRKLLIDLHKKCNECGSKDNLEMHHLDYNESSINTITILCRKCHRRLHRIENQMEDKNANRT